MGAHQSWGQCSRGLWNPLAVGMCYDRALGTVRVPKAILSLCRVALGPKFAPFGDRAALALVGLAAGCFVPSGSVGGGGI